MWHGEKVRIKIRVENIRSEDDHDKMVLGMHKGKDSLE